MALGEIDDVNIVAATGTVFGWIVIAVDAKLFTFATSDLHHNRHEVVWNTIWIFAKKSRWMCANRIEVAQESCFKFWVGSTDVFENFFDEVFGATISSEYLLWD